MSVVVYSTPTCGFCHQIKAYLQQRDVLFVEHDVSQDPRAAQEMLQLSGQQGVPVTVIDGQVVVGFNRPLIDQHLAQRASQPPKLGVSIAPASRIGEQKGLELPEGAYVGRVRPALAGALAGLRIGDVIVQLAGQPVKSDQDVHRVMTEVRYGQMVNLLLWRNGQIIGAKLRF